MLGLTKREIMVGLIATAIAVLHALDVELIAQPSAVLSRAG
jgi:hypothetical protein